MSRTRRKNKKTGGKSVDSSCGNNKGCPVREGNRLHKHNRKKPLPEELRCLVQNVKNT